MAFGHIDGHDIGKSYSSYEEMRQSGVHLHNRAGIAGGGANGASSIVLNGGYEDDEDHGHIIIYTGEGGQDKSGVKQVKDQKVEARGNAALVTSQRKGLPVRVIRGAEARSDYSPEKGFRYDGLYRVLDHWSEKGRSGFLVWRYLLEEIPDDDGLAAAKEISSAPDGEVKPGQRVGWTRRTIRTGVSEWVKKVHDYRCQVCDLRLEVASRRGYAEGAHIRPLGGMHRGQDTSDNVLCLCPNHHVLLDHGRILIDDDLTVRDRNGNVLGELRTVRGHNISVEHLEYHRKTWPLSETDGT